MLKKPKNNKDKRFRHERFFFQTKTQLEHHRTVVAAVVVVIKYTPQLWLTDGTTTTNTSRAENQNNNKLTHKPSEWGERRSESEV